MVSILGKKRKGKKDENIDDSVDSDHANKRAHKYKGSQYDNIRFHSSDEDSNPNINPSAFNTQYSSGPNQTNLKSNSNSPIKLKTTSSKQLKPKSPQPFSQKPAKYTPEEKKAVQKYLNQKRLNQPPTLILQNIPKDDRWTAIPDIQDKLNFLKEKNKQYGKLVYDKMAKIQNQGAKESLAPNSDTSHDHHDVITDSDDDEIHKHHFKHLPIVISDCTELDTVKDQEGNIYDGEWKNGKREGRGALFMGDGSIYVGIWKNDKPNDYGRMIQANGNMYEGHWKEGQPNGYGKYIYNGNDPQKISTYTGDFVVGKREGKGHFYWADGSSYKGQFFDNKIHGKGLYKWAEGKSYLGSWVKGIMDGKGKLIYSDGKVYEGYFKNDKKDGVGKMIWPNNQKMYDGDWKDDQFDGLGVFIQNGEQRKGEWHQGKIIRWIQADQ